MSYQLPVVQLEQSTDGPHQGEDKEPLQMLAGRSAVLTGYQTRQEVHGLASVHALQNLMGNAR